MNEKIINTLDVGIRDLIIFLNDKGIKTSASCSGHPDCYTKEGQILFKTMKDCENFLKLTIKTKVFKSIHYDNHTWPSKKNLWFSYNKNLNQQEIDSLWKLFLEGLK